MPLTQQRLLIAIHQLQLHIVVARRRWNLSSNNKESKFALSVPI